MAEVILVSLTLMVMAYQITLIPVLRMLRFPSQMSPSSNPSLWIHLVRHSTIHIGLSETEAKKSYRLSMQILDLLLVRMERSFIKYVLKIILLKHTTLIKPSLHKCNITIDIEIKTMYKSCCSCAKLRYNITKTRHL